MDLLEKINLIEYQSVIVTIKSCVRKIIIKFILIFFEEKLSLNLYIALHYNINNII